MGLLTLMRGQMTPQERCDALQPAARGSSRSARYDSFAADDVEAVFAAMTPDIEWDESEGMPCGGVYHGRDAIVSNVFGLIFADVEGFTAAPEEILPLDDTRVVDDGRAAGLGAKGPMRARFVHMRMPFIVTDDGTQLASCHFS
jgi:ketosteroid isomerase-like protein